MMIRQNSLERILFEKLTPTIVDVTPGVVVRAYHVGRLVCDMQIGHTYPYYDLASLTKVIFTQQAMMKAFDAKLWTLDTKVKDILSDFNFPEMKITQLLTHTSGMTWWKPFFETMPQIKKAQTGKLVTSGSSWQEGDEYLSIADKRKWLYQEINQSELTSPMSKSTYSDLGFMTLGFVLEKMYDKSLSEIWQDIKSDFYSTTNLDFNLNNQPLLPVNQYAPTEECRWRKKVLRGEVHDENTWALGGISTHAGLFGSVDDVAAYGLNLRSQLFGIARYKIKQKTAQMFSQRALHPDVGDWALGYMMPSAENASCGPHFSIHSIGHTGFTGTSFWYDPTNDLMVIVLSNRVNYGRENKGFISLRPQIHNWIFETVKRNI